MSNWAGGYITDVDYTFGYYAELNPRRLELLFLSSGLVVPEIEHACELGFGQGLSVGIHAAASDTHWFGTDFNAAQASFAREIAAASGAQAQLFGEAFAEFCARPELPDFDYIGLHGIWSWISDENRAVIVDFVRRKLRVGGVLYISYNTQPGWAAMLPVRELLCRHAEVMGSEGAGVLGRVDSALDFADRLFATNPLFVRANPSVAERMKKLRKQNRNYLAHEYFTRDWHPMSFAEVAESLEPAKLGFACSAHYLDHVDALNLTGEQQAFMTTIPDATLRETVRGFMCNTQFRRDYWVKGLRRMDAVERLERLRTQRVALLSPQAKLERKVVGPTGEADLHENVYTPILALLADHRPRSLGQIEQAVQASGLGLGEVLQAVMILAGKGDLAAAQQESVAAKAKRSTDKLNAHLIQKARGSGDIEFLASPVTGGAVSVNRLQQLFLLARGNGKKTPDEWAPFAWQHLAALGQRLTREGRVIESADENLTEVVRLAREFEEHRLPALKALQIL